MIIQTKFTNGGLPALALSPTIRIRKVSDNSLVITDDAMSEVGGGWYKYNFTAYTGSVDYAMRADAGSPVTGYERYVGTGNENFVTDIWDAQVDDHVVSGSIGSAVKFILESENGRWQVVNGQLIVFDENNTTEIARFNVFDSDNNPITDPDFISQRKRV